MTSWHPGDRGEPGGRRIITGEPNLAPSKHAVENIDARCLPPTPAKAGHNVTVFMWSDCPLDLGTDFLVGNMVFV